MKQLLATTLVCLLAAGDTALAQQPTTAPPSAATQTAPPPPDLATAPAVTPQLPNTLMDGAVIKLRIAETLSSENAKVGQQVPFEVTDNVVVQGVTIIPKGSPAIATVTQAEPKRRMGRGGKLDVNIDSTRMADGQSVQLRAVRENKGGGHIGVMTGAMVATSIVFFPAAPLFLLMKGKDITIPKGTEITAFVQGDTHVDMARFTPGGSPSTATASTQTASLSIDSSVPSADIEIDGNFVGSTPSTVSVTPGQHTVTVSKKGYTGWTRTLSIAGPAIHLNADLQASTAQTAAAK